MKNIRVLILIPFLFTCSNNKIRKESFDWIPYKVGDILIFESNTNLVDTIFIKDIDKHTNPDDPLDFFPNYSTANVISGEITLTNPITTSLGTKITKDYVDILELSSGRDSDYLILSFKKRRDTLAYSRITLKISDLEKQFENKSEFESIQLDPAIYDDFKSDVKYVFWSKKFGYTKYQFKNGHIWELSQFIRDSKNIFKK